jgi:hypothetical protein
MTMGLFGDDNNNDLVDMTNKVPAEMLRQLGRIWRAYKPIIRDIQATRDQIALAHAARQMQQQVQPPDSPGQSPATSQPMGANADLSLPPKRKSGS